MAQSPRHRQSIMNGTTQDPTYYFEVVDGNGKVIAQIIDYSIDDADNTFRSKFAIDIDFMYNIEELGTTLISPGVYKAPDYSEY